MSTTPLFDYAESIHRSTDPVTSRQAAASVNCGRLRTMFLTSLQRLGEATAKEIGYDATTDTLLAESVRKRASELCKLGLVEVCGVRQCRISGNGCQVYRLTGKG